MNLIYLLTGIAIGAIGIYFYFKNKIDATAQLQNNAALLTQQVAQLTTAHNTLQTEHKVLQSQQEQYKHTQTDVINTLEKNKNEIVTKLNADVLKLEESYKQLVNTSAAEQATIRTNYDAILTQERNKIIELNASVEKSREVFKAQEVRMKEILIEKEELTKKLSADFEVLANRILDEKSSKFTEQNKNNLDIILNPLKERIKTFEDKIDQNYKEETTERLSLKTEIKNLVNLNKQVSDDANNLARALKGENKTQGNWGEVILEKILESSGLRKGEEYELQHSFVDNAGVRNIPDAVINLPENKHIIIDAKVSLVAYERAVNATTDEERDLQAKAHVKSVKDHIKVLSEKNYQAADKFNTPEFVLLFMPIESMFSAAIQTDVEVFNYAWDRKIVIVSPSTLLATLKTISSIWKQEKQNKYTLEIAEESGKLYDQFVMFIEDLEDVGKKLNDSQEAYDNSFKRLKTGNNNIFRQVDKLKDLGAKAKKKIPEKYLDGAEREGENKLEM
ncbi:MAG: DNA recombination protein RmuC [Bacteroidia bacterium]